MYLDSLCVANTIAAPASEGFFDRSPKNTKPLFMLFDEEIAFSDLYLCSFASNLT